MFEMNFIVFRSESDEYFLNTEYKYQINTEYLILFGSTNSSIQSNYLNNKY